MYLAPIKSYLFHPCIENNFFKLKQCLEHVSRFVKISETFKNQKAQLNSVLLYSCLHLLLQETFRKKRRLRFPKGREEYDWTVSNHVLTFAGEVCWTRFLCFSFFDNVSVQICLQFLYLYPPQQCAPLNCSSHLSIFILPSTLFIPCSTRYFYKHFYLKVKKFLLCFTSEKIKSFHSFLEFLN